MIRNYLKIAWRTLVKYPVTTGINLFGLTVGLATCLLITLFVRYEWGFDRFHPLGDRVFRVNEISKTGSDMEYSGIVPYPLGNALRNDFSDWPVIASVHTEENTSVVISPEKILSEKKVLFAEPQLFDIFSFQMIIGKASTILAQPNQVILSESAAKNYFGTASPIGKTFRLGQSINLQVAGIMRDIPAQSHLAASMIVSYKTLKRFMGFDISQWGLRSAGSVYALLPEGEQPGQYTSRLQKAANTYYTADNQSGKHRQLVLQPLEDIHFNTTFEGSGFTPAIDPTYLWVFGAIGLFVLLIACVNFVNMTTARATTRAKEVGVRKVIGATSNQLVSQFLGEAFWITAISSVMALLLTYWLLPLANSFMQKQVVLDWPIVLGIILFLGTLTTLAAGAYPALFMARFKPIRVLKSRAEMGRRGQGWLRQSLVVFQFSVSLILAIGVLVIYQQMKLFRDKDLGFNRDAIITINIPEPGKNLYPLRQAWSQIPGVQHISFGLGAPTSPNNFGTGVHPDPGNQNLRINIDLKIADAQYQQTYGLKLVAGRFFSDADTLAIASRIPAEQRHYVFIVNETLTKALGYAKPEQIIGRKIKIGLNDLIAEVVGVVKDFHASSLRNKINPVVIVNFPSFYYSAGIKLQTRNYASTLAALEQVWKQYYPNSLYEAEFLDQSLQKLYDEENRQFVLLRVFAGLAISICCLGLWGLATFTIERRTKEIGVRKVLGASIGSVVVMLSSDFMKLVFVALVVASPIAWFLMNKWLQDFAYKIEISWWMFALAGLLAIGIALLTVSFQSIKAALMNPVKSLKAE